MINIIAQKTKSAVFLYKIIPYNKQTISPLKLIILWTVNNQDLSKTTDVSSKFPIQLQHKLQKLFKMILKFKIYTDKHFRESFHHKMKVKVWYPVSKLNKIEEDSPFLKAYVRRKNINRNVILIDQNINGMVISIKFLKIKLMKT
jgi:hypothetical protein